MTSTRDRILAVLQPGVVLDTVELARACREDQRLVYVTARKMAQEQVLQKSTRRAASAAKNPPVRWRRRPA